MCLCVSERESIHSHAVVSARQYLSPHLLIWSITTHTHTFSFSLCYMLFFAVVTSNFNFNSLNLPLLQLVQTLSHTYVYTHTHIARDMEVCTEVEYWRLFNLHQFPHFDFILILPHTVTLILYSLPHTLLPLLYLSLSQRHMYTLISVSIIFCTLPFSLSLALLSFDSVSLCLCRSHSVKVPLFSPCLRLSSCTVS